MTKLHQLHDEQAQSPWIDDLKRRSVTGGRLAELIALGVRGITSNPTIFRKAMTGSGDYDEQFETLLKDEGVTVEDAYWTMAIEDITGALDLFRETYDESRGNDGFVSLEVPPSVAHNTEATIAVARRLHERIQEPNLLVKIPATKEGTPAIRQMISEGRSINVTLIFSLESYGDVIEAYLSGLEAHPGDLSGIASVASFFVSRVDTEVDRRLEAIGTDESLSLRGRAAVAQAKLAYQLFRSRFSGERWAALVQRGARVQRPLWASTSTKNERYPDLLYVDSLIGPDTVNTMPESTLMAFLDHGTVRRTVDEGVEEAKSTLDRIEELGVEMMDVSRTIEDEGVAVFTKSYDDLLAALNEKAAS